jgi:hypothetical protein
VIAAWSCFARNLLFALKVGITPSATLIWLFPVLAGTDAVELSIVTVSLIALVEEYPGGFVFTTK